MKNNAKLSPFTKTGKGDNKIILLSLTMTSYLPSQAYKIILLSHLSNLLNETNLKHIKLDPVIIIINNQICRDSLNIFM
jgi:hypothetical protein